MNPFWENLKYEERVRLLNVGPLMKKERFTGTRSIADIVDVQERRLIFGEERKSTLI